MTPTDIDRVFGRGRLRMVTGDHVEVFREEALPGERRRYTKRFLATAAGDFRHWTEREWRILARLVGHGIGPVPDVVQFDRGVGGKVALVQTYDAGITVDHWATLLPVQRDGVLLNHVFEDCAHWWALARHSLIALDAIHELGLVHLDLKADNVCVPFGPADFDPGAAQAGLTPRFEQIALIDFAFSLVSGEQLLRPLPIARQTEYDYQSPRLLAALDAGGQGDLAPTRALDWRCDLFSLAAMLRRLLPDPEAPPALGWSRGRDTEARALVRRLLQVHDADLPALRPHAELFTQASLPLADPTLAASLERGWQLAPPRAGAGALSPTPVTRIALPVEPAAVAAAAAAAVTLADPAIVADLRELPHGPATAAASPKSRRSRWLWAGGAAAAAALAVPLLGEAWLGLRSRQAAPSDAVLAKARPAPVGAPASRPRAAAPVVASVVASVPAPPVALNLPAPPPPASPPAPATSAAAAAPTPRVAPASAVAASPATPSRGGVRSPRPEPRVALAKPTAPPKNAASAAAAKAVPPTGVGIKPPPAQRVAAARPALPARPVTLPPRAAPTLPEAPLPPRAAPTLPPWPTSAAAGVATAPAVVTTVAAPRSVPSSAPAAIPLPAPAVPPAAAAPRDHAARASELISNQLPRLAQRAERLVLRVLVAAADSEDEDDLRSAARAIRLAPGDSQLEPGAAPAEARALNEAARTAFWRRGDLQTAVALQTRAFGANPLDAEVAGNLAFLRLKQQPQQPEAARQLALHALTTHDPRFPHGRIEDWTTLAITNSLTGRERDARNAWLVTLELAPQPERQCRAAVNAYAAYGERVRPAVEAMLFRAHSAQSAHRGSERSALCEWPPHWGAGASARR